MTLSLNPFRLKFSHGAIVNPKNPKLNSLQRTKNYLEVYFKFPPTHET